MKKILIMLIIIIGCFAFTLDRVDALDNTVVLSGQNDFPDLSFGDEGDTCKEVLGPTLTYFLKGVRIVIQVLGIGLAVANGMISFIPAITKKDQDALQKALKKFVKILIILALLLMLPSLIAFLGHLGGLDLSCL